MTMNFKSLVGSREVGVEDEFAAIKIACSTKIFSLYPLSIFSTRKIEVTAYGR